MTTYPPPAGRRRPLWYRLLAACALVVLCALAVLAVPLYQGLQRDYITRATQSFAQALDLERLTLRTAAEADDRVGLDLACERLNRPYQGRVSIIDRQGRLLADSMSARCLQRARPECQEAILSLRRDGEADRVPLENTVTLRLPLQLGRRGDATIRLALPIEPVRRQMALVSRRLALATAGALALVGVMSLWLSRRIARPLEDMTRVAERIAAGDFDCRTPPAGSDEVGRLAGAVGSMQRSLRQTLGELRAERNQAQAIVAGMSDGVVALAADGTVLYANQAAAAMLGQPDLQPGAALAPPAPLAAALAEANRSRESAAVEWGDVRRGERVIHVSISPLPDQAGGTVLVLCDRTEARRAESMGRELAANASHELRTPLAILSSTLETLLAWPENLPPASREFLEIGARQVDRMHRLVNETLQLAQLEAGAPAETRAALDLADLAGQVVHDLQPLAESRQVELRPLQSAGAAPVLGLEQPLLSALTNLVDNALRYTPSGGRVTVAVDATDGRAVVAVTDNGPGISPLEQSRLFDRFVRGQAAADSRGEGSGLGLAIARRVAEIHSGEITVDSAPGQGSTFRIALPIHGAAPEPARPGGERSA